MTGEHGSPKVNKNVLLKDFTLNQKGSPIPMNLPRLGGINHRPIIDAKALGKFWKSEENMYYD